MNGRHICAQSESERAAGSPGVVPVCPSPVAEDRVTAARTQIFRNHTLATSSQVKSSSSRLHSADSPQIHQGAALRVCVGSASGKASEVPSGRSDGSCACKAKHGGLYCQSVINEIRFSTKNRWHLKILKSSRCRTSLDPS